MTPLAQWRRSWSRPSRNASEPSRSAGGIAARNRQGRRGSASISGSEGMPGRLAVEIAPDGGYRIQLLIFATHGLISVLLLVGLGLSRTN
jgi:hypothetical protein